MTDNFKLHVDAAQKFDYFVTGAAGAALSYIVQSYTRSAGDRWWLLVDLAMVSLLVAFSSGLLYLSTTVRALRMSNEVVVAEERLSALREAVRKNVGVYVPGLDMEIGPANIPHVIDIQTSELTKMRAVLDPITARQIRSLRVRNGFLATGLMLLTAWKILQGF